MKRIAPVDGTLMKILRTAALVAAAAFVAVAALAGDEPRCTMPLAECIEKISAHMKMTGWVGVELEVDEDAGTYRVTAVIPESPAEKGGIRPGDMLLEVNGTPISNRKGKTLEDARRDWKPGRSVTYTIKRGDVDRRITLTLAPMPADLMAKYIGRHVLEHQANEEQTPNP